MCKKQIGRRNITDEQRTVLIGEAYKAQKMSRGAAEGFRGNQHTKVVKGQNDPLPNPSNTALKIARNFGIGEKTVKRAEQFLDGLNAAEEVVPRFKVLYLGVISAYVTPILPHFRSILTACFLGVFLPFLWVLSRGKRIILPVDILQLYCFIFARLSTNTKSFRTFGGVFILCQSGENCVGRGRLCTVCTLFMHKKVYHTHAR